MIQIKQPIQAAQPGHIFGVFVVAALIGGVTLIERGAIAEGTFLGLLVFLLIGALVPPVAITVGIIILAYLLLTGGALSLFSWSNSLIGSKAPTVQSNVAATRTASGGLS